MGVEGEEEEGKSWEKEEEGHNEAGKGGLGPSSSNAAPQERTETARRGKLDRGKAVRTE